MNREERAEIRRKRVAARRKRMAERDALLEVGDANVEIVDKKLTIEICIHCHRYQHRLCWMLSSILQQQGNAPNLNVNVSFCPDDGNPTTKEVCDFFRKSGLNMYETVLTPKEVPNRSIGRNRQVKQVIETKRAEWMLFADSDMVYDNHFFEDIQMQLNGKYKDVTKVIGADRISLNIPFCIKYFEDDEREYPCVVSDVAEIASQWPVKWVTGKTKCPGNFQLASVDAIIKNGGVYTKRSRDVWRSTRSDRGFRAQMKGHCSMNVKPQYHLNHDRGGPELQR